MVQLESSGGVARVLLDRPEKANALNPALLEELFSTFEALKGDAGVRVAVLAGRGKAFCGGADTNELKSLDEASAPAFVERIHKVCAAIRGLPVPVVAQLHGAVIGAGLEIAASCDLRIAADGTKFSMPEVKIGIPSVVEAALLPRLMGSGRAAWLVLTGEAIDAQRACEWGLVEKVSSTLQHDIETLVGQLLAADREALRLQKELLQLWEEAPLAKSIAASLASFARAHRK